MKCRRCRTITPTCIKHSDQIRLSRGNGDGPAQKLTQKSNRWQLEPLRVTNTVGVPQTGTKKKIRELAEKQVKTEKKIVISDVLKMLIKNNNCAVMTSCSNELLEYLIEKVNNKQTAEQIDDKYIDSVKKFALTLHFYCPRTYSKIQRQFDPCLPHSRAISQWHIRSDSRPGITLQSVEKIKELAGEKQSFICLSFNEIHIREQTERDADLHHGYVNVGNDLYGDFVEIANEALVVTALSLNSCWEMPIAYFFGRNFTGTQKAELLKLCIDALTAENVRVVCVIVDGTPANVNMASVLGANFVIPPYVPHFIHNEAVYYLIIKPSFLSKLAKNLFSTERLLYHGNEMIDYTHVETFFMTKYKFCENNIADRELWDNTIATGIEYIQKESQSQEINYLPTVTFIRNISNLLSICKSITNPCRRCDKETKEECSKLCNYIRKIKLGDGICVVDSPRKLAFTGFLYNVLALKRLYADYILSGKINYIPNQQLLSNYVTESHFDLSRLSSCVTARQVSSFYKQFLCGCGVSKCDDIESYEQQSTRSPPVSESDCFAGPLDVASNEITSQIANIDDLVRHLNNLILDYFVFIEKVGWQRSI